MTTPPDEHEALDACRSLLDALAFPDGRHVADAWDRACMLLGRYGSAMKRAAFEQYLDELAGIKR